LLAGFGYEEEAGEGSRRKFIHREKRIVIAIHQPHPGNELKSYQVREVLLHLKGEGYL
jgi:predicted RNA binding protein YcfA (HicA-like mRNA interferase family)